VRKLRTELRAQTAQVARLETEQAENAAEFKEQLEGLAAEIAAVERRAKKREETTRRQQAAAVERLAKKLETKLAAHDERTTKSEVKSGRAAPATTKKLLKAEAAAVERRLEEREETTRRQLADTVESLVETVNAEMAKVLERVDRSDEGQQRQLAEAIERLTRAEEALEAGAQPVPSTSGRKKAEAVKLPKGKLDVNSLTFEQFRALGLTATQSSRMIAMRDRVGKFSDIDQINDVVGLPAKTRTMLKRRLKVG
jgi:DNA uptake protein ComE-like DNA-binding protein